ncbi:hypothetical protein TNCV_1592981 [Trichonephila clavipes]|nr:hypothetical protein TNCV_1592981 [Trichonephila clavipes]
MSCPTMAWQRTNKEHMSVSDSSLPICYLLAAVEGRQWGGIDAFEVDAGGLEGRHTVLRRCKLRYITRFSVTIRVKNGSFCTGRKRNTRFGHSVVAARLCGTQQSHFLLKPKLTSRLSPSQYGGFDPLLEAKWVRVLNPEVVWQAWYGQKSPMTTSSRIGVHESLCSASSTTRLPG